MMNCSNTREPKRGKSQQPYQYDGIFINIPTGENIPYMDEGWIGLKIKRKRQ